MDNLGVAMNATTLQAYALEKGINFEWKTASNAEKAELAMKMFFERTAQYEGNFARESEETISGSLGAMKAAFKDLLGNLTLGQDITPSLNALMQTTMTFAKKNLIPALGNIIKSLPSALGTILNDVFASITPETANGAVKLVTSLADGITAQLPTLIPAAAQAVSTLVLALTSPENQSLVVNSAIQLITALNQGIIAALPQLIAAIPSLVKNIAVGLINNAPVILEAIGQILMQGLQLMVVTTGQIWSTVGPYIQQAAESAKAYLAAKIPEIINNVGQFFAQLPEKIAYWLGVAIGKLIQWGQQAIQWAGTAVPQFINNVGSYFAQLPSKLWSHLLNTLLSIRNFFSNAISTAVSETPRIASTVVNGFISLPGKMLDIGRNIVAGLWNGIKNRWSSLVNNVSGLIGSFISGIKSGLGIASPSKVTKGIGEYVTEGLALGITGKAGMVKSAIDEITRITTGTMQSDMSVNAALSGTPAGTGYTGNSEVVSAIYMLLDAIKNLKLYLDGDTLVGGIIDSTDRMLGARQMQAERGVI